MTRIASCATMWEGMQRGEIVLFDFGSTMPQQQDTLLERMSSDAYRVQQSKRPRSHGQVKIVLQTHQSTPTFIFFRRVSLANPERP